MRTLTQSPIRLLASDQRLEQQHSLYISVVHARENLSSVRTRYLSNGELIVPKNGEVKRVKKLESKEDRDRCCWRSAVRIALAHTTGSL